MLRKDVTFENSGPPVTQQDIDAAKAALGGITLPLDYERYLLRFNGAWPKLTTGNPDRVPHLRVWWPADSIADVSDHSAEFDDFYELHGRAEKGPDLIETHRDIGQLLPPDTVAFASSGGGSRFLFDLRPERFGQVLYWSYNDLGDDAMFASNPYHNVAWVASDFVDFINRIERSPDDWNAWEASLAPDSDVGWRSR